MFLAYMVILNLLHKLHNLWLCFVLLLEYKNNYVLLYFVFSSHSGCVGAS